MREEPPPRLCACGCEEMTAINHRGQRNRYVKGHFGQRSPVTAISDVAVGPIEDRIAAIEQWVQKRDTVSPGVVKGLGERFSLTPKEVRLVIDRARLKLGANAEQYVAAHMESVTAALEIGTEKGLEVAQRGAEWAMERIGQGASRVTDAPKAGGGSSGPQIIIGIQVGGIHAANTAESEPIESKPNVMITSGEVVETPPVEKHQLALAQKPPRAAPPKPTAKTKAMEAKASKLLSAVTQETAPAITRALIEAGYTPTFAWEMVKEMLAVDAAQRV